MREFTWWHIFSGALCLAFIFWMFMLVCGIDWKTRARESLGRAGYTNVQFQGRDFWACGQEDWFRQKFTATDSAGHLVEATVCCGAAKKCTVRY